MYRFITALRMCISMFTAFPLPVPAWDEGLRKQCTACLPLVGLLIGLLWWPVAAIARALLPVYLAGALVAAFPLLVTGFIHLDGYMDAADALLSWRSREERIRILKDVHCGSFSVVMLVLLVLFQFAAAMSVERLFPLALIPVLSRCGSAYSVMKLAPLGHSEYAGAGDTPEKLLSAVKWTALAALALLLVFSGWGGLLAGAAVLGGYALAMRRCFRSMGGVSGDLAGFALTLSELCGLIVLALV